MRNLVLTLITALTFSGVVQATELTCEQSHLSTPSPNLDQIAANLAKLRLQIYQMPTAGEKSRANEEFKAKYAEFEPLTGNKDKAKKLFQEQIRILKTSSAFDQLKELEKKEREQKEREKELTKNPIHLAREMKFHEIRPGPFAMGPENYIVTEITKPFAMMETLFTQMMWARIQIALGERNPNNVYPFHFIGGPDSVTVVLDGSSIPMNPDHPAEMVSWNQVMKMINGLNELSKSDDSSVQEFLKSLIPDHRKGDIYDLPTEAQWEFVMKNRGQAKGAYFDRNDDKELSKFAWFNQNAKQNTHAVATLQPRIIDGAPIYDLEGNVAEFTKDNFSDELMGGKDPVNSTVASIGGMVALYYPVVRGGGYSQFSAYLRTNERKSVNSNTREKGIGFRLVRTRP